MTTPMPLATFPFRPEPLVYLSDAIEAIEAATEQGKRQPLTDERISTIARVTQTAEPGRDGYILPFSFAREIEAAHGITTPKDKL